MFARWLVLALCVQLVWSENAIAQVAQASGDVSTTPASAPSHSVTATPINMDLSSAVSSQSASSLLRANQTAQINVNGTRMPVTSSSMLTPAQFMALSQVMAGSPQSIQLSQFGTASGGTVCLSCIGATRNIDSLVVPSGVKVISDFGKTTGVLNIGNVLTTNGSFYAVSSNSLVTNAIISATNINVGSTGLLTTVLPPTGLSGFSNLLSNVSLTLNARDSIVNHGTISSAANLTVNAPNITSSAGAVIQALNGAVSIKNAGDLKIDGGSIFARWVLLDAGCGNLSVSLKDASGAFNVTAAAAKIAVLDGTHGFNLASINITDDPDLIFNGSGDYTSTGFNALGGVVDITTTGAISFTGNITTTPSTTGAGGYVNLDAGTTINVLDITTSGKTSGAAGSITLNAGGAITAGSLTATGAGTGADGAINVTAGGSLGANAINGGAVTLLSNGNMTLGGALQSSGAVDVNAAGTFNALAINGSSVNLASNNNMTLGGTLQSTGAVDVTAGGTLDAKAISGGAVNLLSNGNTTLGGALSSTGAITVETQGGGNFTQTAGNISASSLTLRNAGGAFGTSAVPLNTTVGSLTVGTTGGSTVYINQTGALTLNTSNVNGDFKLLTNTNFTLGSAVSANNFTIQGTGTNTSITVNVNPSVNLALTLNATGTGTVTPGSGVVFNAPALVLSSGSASFGTAAVPYQFASQNIAVSTTGSAFLANTNAVNVNLQPSTVGGTLKLGANGNVSTNGTVSAAIIDIRSTAANGGITVNGNLTSTGAMSLTATGSGNISNPAGTITAGALTLASGTGNIGSGGFLNTKATSITATTGGTGSIQISQTGTLNLLPSSAGGDFYLKVNAPSFNLNSLQNVGGNFIITGTGSNTSIAVNQNPNVGSSFGLVTSGTGTITEGSGVIISAPIVQLNTSNADIGTSTTPLQISTGKAQILSNANAYVSNDKNLQLLGGTTVGGKLQVLNNGNITTVGAIAANDLILTSTAANGSIIFNSDVSGGSTSQFTATGTGTITRTSGAIYGGTANLNTAGGNVGSAAAPIVIKSSFVNASSGAGSIYLDAQSDTVLKDIASNSLIQVTGSSGAVTTIGNVTAPVISLQSNNGVFINSNITATTSITVTGSGSARIGTSGGLLTAPTVTLVTNSADIGSQFAPIQTQAGTLAANSTSGSVYVNNLGAFVVDNSSAGTALQISSTGDMHVTGVLTSPALTLQTTANNANIVVETAVSAPGGLTVASDGTGAVTFNQPVSTTPTVQGDGGSVAITAGGALNFTSITTASNGTATSGTAGNVVINAGGLVTGNLIDTGVHSTTNGVGAGAVSVSAGGINISTIDSSNLNGDGASIGVASSGALTLGNLYSYALGNGGPISLSESGTSQINVTGVISSYSASTSTTDGKTGGNITIAGTSGINVSGLINTTTHSSTGGNLFITNTSTGDISFSAIDTSSDGQIIFGFDGLLNPSGGSININQKSAGNVTVNGGIDTSGIKDAFGGDIAIKLAGGALDITGTVDSSSNAKIGGHIDVTGTASAVSFNSLGASTDTAIKSSGGGSSQFYSGNIRILPKNADVTVTGDILTSGNGGAASAAVVIDDVNSINVNGNIITSNASAPGRNVLLQASGNVTAGDVLANGGFGSGGVISIAAGTGGTGDLLVGNLSSTGVGSNQSGGAVTLTSGGNLQVGTVTADGAGGAFGGTVTMVAGYQPSSVGAGGPGDITYGNISSTGTWGGNVSVVSLGTSGTINNPGSTITTNAFGLNGIAGSVSLSSPGVITVGDISSQAGNGANAYAGSVFVSSGASGNAITVANINTSSSGTAGNVFLVVNPTSTITDNPASITQTGTTTNTITGTTSGYLFDNPAAVTPTTDISGTMTANFGTTVSGYNPGGYLTASDSTANLTVFTNGDTRLFVPLAVLQGGATVNSLNSQSLTVGSNTYASPLSVYAAGNVAIATAVSAISVNAPAPSVNFVSTIGSVSAPSLTVQGDPATQVVLSSPTNFTLSNGSSIFNSATGTAGIVTISVPNGSINLGSPGNFSNNTLEANGAAGGIINLAASGNIVDYGVAISAKGTSGAGGSVNISSSEGKVSFYNEYSGGSTIPASIDVSSTGGAGGAINIYARYGVDVLADGTATTPSAHVFQANGTTNGGAINISAPNGYINLADNQSVNVQASAAGGTAGSIYLFAPFDAINANNLNAASDNGGSIRTTSSTFNLNNGNTITANGNNGVGGNILLYTGGVRFGGGDITLGSADNRTGNLVTATGTTGGGTVAIAAGGNIYDFEVGVLADTTSGTGGVVSMTASADIQLMNSYFNNPGPANYNSLVSANSAAGAGGQVTIDAQGRVLSQRDTASGLSGNTSNHAITANGTTAGGTILIRGADINLADTDQILAVGSDASSQGGSISILSDTGNTVCCYSSVTSVINAQGGLLGGSIDIESNGGHIDLSVNNKITTSAPGTTGGTTLIQAPNSWVTTNLIDSNVPGSTVTVRAGGDMTNIGAILADVIDMKTVANSGSIRIAAPITATTSATLYASQSGSIVNTLGYGNGVVTAPTASLTSEWANIGNRTAPPPSPGVQVAASLDPQFVFVNAGNLTLNAGQNIYVNSISPTVNLVGNSQAGTGGNEFMLESSGNINLNGTASVGSTQWYSGSCCNGYSWIGNFGIGTLTMETYGGAGDITVNGTANGYGQARFVTAGTGKFNLPAAASVNSNGTVYVQSYGADIQGSIFAQNQETENTPNGDILQFYGGSVQLVPNGSQSVAIGDLTGTTGTFDVPQSFFSRMTTENLTIGGRVFNGTSYDYINTGDIKVYGDVDLSGARGSAGVYSLNVMTGGNFDGTGYKVSISTGADDNHQYNVTTGGNLITGSASGGYYQSFNADGLLTINGTLDNTNSLYQFSQVFGYSKQKIDVVPTGNLNSIYSYLESPVINIDGTVNATSQAQVYNFSYLANNVAQPTYSMTLTGSGSITAPLVYVEDYHYTYDPTTFQSTFQGGTVNGTIGQINGPVYAYAPNGASSGTGVFSLFTTNGDLRIQQATAENSLRLGTDGVHSLILMTPANGSIPSTLTSKDIHLTTGTLTANLGLRATAGAVLIDSPTGFGLTVNGTNGTINFNSTAGNTIRATDGVLSIQSTLRSTVTPSAAVPFNLQATGVNGAITIGPNITVSSDGNMNVTTPSLTVGAGSTLGTVAQVAISNSGSPLVISNNGTLGSQSDAFSITNDQNITFNNGVGSATAGLTTSVTSTAGSITVNGALSAVNSMTLNGALGVASTDTVTGLSTPVLTVSGGGGPISIAATSATGLTANSTDAVSIVGTAAGIITLNPSSGSSFALTASNAAGGINGASLLNSATVNLAAGSGGIDFATNGSLNAQTLTVTVPTGTVNVKDTFAGVVSLGTSSANSFTMNATNGASGILATGVLTAGSVDLTAGTGGIDFATSGSMNTGSLVLSNATGNVNINNSYAGVFDVGGSTAQSLTLNASDAAGGINATGALSSATVSLSAGSGGIDVSTNGSLNASTLTVNTPTGAAVIKDTLNGVVSLGASSALSLDLTTSGGASGIKAIGALDAASVSLTSGSAGIDFRSSGSLNAGTLMVVNPTGAVVIDDTNAGIISVAGVTAASFDLNASAATGGINATGTIATPTLNLSAGSGGIDVSSSGSTNASTLTVSSPTANVIILDTLAGTVSVGNSTAGSFDLITSDAASGIKAIGVVDAATVSLTSGSGGIDFATSGSTTGSTVSANANGAVTINDSFAGVVSLGASSGTTFRFAAIDAAGGIATTGQLDASSVNLISGSGGITATAAAPLNAPNLTVTSTGAVSLVDNSASTINVNNVAANSFDLQSTASSINIAGAFGAANGVSLDSANSITNGGGTITASSLDLAAVNDIGASNSRLSTSVGTVSTSSAVNEYINNTGALQIGDTTASTAINILNAGDATVTGTVTGPALTLATTAASNGNISIGGTVDMSGPISLTTGGTGAASVSGTLGTTGGDITVNSASFTVDGSVSDSAAKMLIQHTGTLSVGGTGTMDANQIEFNSANVIVGANANLSLTNATPTAISTNGLTFQNASALNSANAQGFNVTPLSGTALTVVAPDGSTGMLTTQGGAMNLTAGTISFDKSAGAGTATVAFNGGPLNLSATTVNVAPNVIVDSNNNVVSNARTTNNDGTLSSALQLSITNANGVTVNGSGTLGGTTVSLNSSNGAIAVTQGAINGVATGDAGTSFSLTTSAANLNLGSATARDGAITATANGFNLNVVDTAALTASRNVLLTAGQIVNVGSAGGTGVSINSGTLIASANPTSTNRADYNYNAVVDAGSTIITGSSGVTLGDNVSVLSRGASIGILSDNGSVNFGSGSNLFAQGGNVWINANADVDLGTGTQVTSVARDIPNGVFNITSFGDIVDFNGGNIGINVNVMTPNYDSYLKTNYDAARDRNGTYTVSSGVVRTNLTTSILHGGTIDLTQSFSGKIAVLNSTFNVDGGVIQLDPPGSTLNVSGATFNAIGPQLDPLPPVPPSPVVPSGGIGTTPPSSTPALVPNFNGLTAEIASINATPKSTITPVDQTKVINFVTQTTPDTARQCTPVVMAPYVEQGWSVAAGSCQSFAVKGDNDSAILGAGGSSVSSEGPRNVTLNKGQMVAMSGKNGLSVATSSGAVVEVPAESAVMVEESATGVLRVIQLSGKQANITLKGKDAPQVLSTTAGQEIVVASESTDDEELIPIDGVERVEIAATLRFSGVQVKKNKFDAKRMIEQTKLLNCHQGCFPIYIRERINKTKSAAAAAPSIDTKTKNTAQIETTDPALRPVAFTTPAPVAVRKINSLDSDVATIKHLGAKFTMTTPEEMNLDSGEAVVSATKSIDVRAGKFTAKLVKGAIAAVAYNDGIIAVRNVSDTGAHSVTVVYNNHTVDVPVGGEILMSDPAGALDKFLADDNIGRRQVKRSTIENAAVMASEISFVSVIQESALLNKLFLSAEDDDKSISQRIAKTAVALSITTARHGSFAPLKP